MRTSLLAGLLTGLAALLLACSAGEESGSGQTQDPIAAGAEAGDAHALDRSRPGEAAAAEVDVPAENRPSAKGDKDDRSKLAKRQPGERPLPAFKGRTLAGEMLEARDLLGKRLLLLFFNPTMQEGRVVATAAVEIAKQADRNNFRVVGVAVGASSADARATVAELGIDFPVIDDSSARIANLFGLRGPLLVLTADADGYLTYANPYFATEGDDATTLVETELARVLRIQGPEAEDGALIDHPLAPTFETVTIDGEPFDFASVDGKPVILFFFLHTCPHCHEALGFLKGVLEAIDEAKRPVLLGVSVQNRPFAVKPAMAEAGLDYFPILMDPDREVIEAYGVRGGVPDIMLIDGDRRIVQRVQGWREDRDPSIMRMQVAKLAGVKVPMLLNPTGYTGNDACAVCHEQEAATWAFTPHARAYDTLVTHGADRNTECVSCHVVGYGEPGGYSFENPQPFLENVGCENCHGRGGPHLSPGFVANDDYEPVCATCHNPTHSLGFAYSAFSEQISHAKIAAMTPAERKGSFGEGAHPRTLMPTDIPYVGSDLCQGCHEAETAAWADHPHGRSMAPLIDNGQQANEACLECHTTGMGQRGGFDPAKPYLQQPDLARVGCESCHGPGGEHIKPEAKKLGSIISLGDKCDSCVILQICGTCHDPENDPDFEFNVEDHIERQRHGTIEAGTGKPLDAEARTQAAADPIGSAERALARALRKMDDRG